ncbi:response regulator [Devosia sp. CAU 1758]
MSSEPTIKHGALIIDPRANMATLVADMLRTLGRHDISESSEASQALLHLGRRSYDVVIIDDSLIGPDAVELVRRIRADIAGPNRLTPVIMMSAAPDAARIAAARDAGVTEFLRKPFSARDLKARLDSLNAAPRPFVEAQSYAGPDRRRKARAIGNAERRSR